MTKFHLAQVNIAKRLAAMNDPIMQGFIDNVHIMNAIADASEGFIWRMKDENKDLVSEIFNDDSLLINISVWENLESLFNYTYNSEHIKVFKRKKEWFSKIKMPYMAFWYLPIGKEPTLEDAKKRLTYLSLHGETPYAFTFKSKFTVADALNYKITT